MEQKLISIMKSGESYLLGMSGSDSYLGSQCEGNSGLSKDIASGWIVKHIFEDRLVVSILLERK